MKSVLGQVWDIKSCRTFYIIVDGFLEKQGSFLEKKGGKLELLLTNMLFHFAFSHYAFISSLSFM